MVHIRQNHWFLTLFNYAVSTAEFKRSRMRWGLICMVIGKGLWRRSNYKWSDSSGCYLEWLRKTTKHLRTTNTVEIPVQV